MERNTRPDQVATYGSLKDLNENGQLSERHSWVLEDAMVSWKRSPVYTYQSNKNFGAKGSVQI
jgi:hypothetical protein